MQNQMFFAAALGAVVAFVAVNWAYFKVLRIALDKNLVDNPDARKLQKRPVPVMGGIAVYFGVLAGVLCGAVLHALTGAAVPTRLLPVMCAMSVMLYVGALDDILGLSPRSRMVIEVLTVLALVFASGRCIDSLHGLWGVEAFSWWIAVPLTVFAGVGIINAVNMIDGVNGLSSGLCITCCAVFGVSFVMVGDVPNAVLAFSTVGALIPFFVHNVFGNHSRMFIGDAGTMVMGILLTWFSICTLDAQSSADFMIGGRVLNPVALVLAVMSVPVFDTIRVMGMRMLRHKSPFLPDKTHLHHVFVSVGISHFITTVSEILIGVVVVAALVVSALCGAGADIQLYSVIVAAVLFVWGTYFILKFNADRHTAFLHFLTGFSVRTHLGRSEWWRKLTAWLDGPCKAFAEEDAEPQEAPTSDLKERDRRLVLGFMKGRAEVLVSDIMENSGAERLRVYAILFEEVQRGRVAVTKEDGFGGPEIVMLTNQ